MVSLSYFALKGVVTCLPAKTYLQHSVIPSKTDHLGRGWDAKKSRPPRMGTARRLAEAYTARIVWQEVSESNARPRFWRPLHCHCANPLKHPRKFAWLSHRHRGFATLHCSATQKEPKRILRCILWAKMPRIGASERANAKFDAKTPPPRRARAFVHCSNTCTKGTRT